MCRMQAPHWLTIVLNVLLMTGFITTAYYTLRVGITPMPSSRKAVSTMIGIMPRNVKGTIVDLGAGWGTLGYPVAKAFPEATVIGYELSPIPWAYSRIKQAIARRPNLTFERKDIFEMDLSTADIALVYLQPRAMRRLSPKLRDELKPGALVLSNSFPLPGWEQSAVYELSTHRLSTSRRVYAYEV